MFFYGLRRQISKSENEYTLMRKLPEANPPNVDKYADMAFLHFRGQKY